MMKGKSVIAGAGIYAREKCACTRARTFTHAHNARMKSARDANARIMQARARGARRATSRDRPEAIHTGSFFDFFLENFKIFSRAVFSDFPFQGNLEEQNYIHSRRKIYVDDVAALNFDSAFRRDAR